MMKMKNIRNLILGLLIITTSLTTAQTECVKRTNRYTEAPSVVTIYPCNSLEFINTTTNVHYNVAILVDSIYATEKIYRLYGEFSAPVNTPIFEIELTSGATMIILPNYTPDGGKYVEAMLTAEQLVFFKTNCVKNISVWEENINDNPKLPCENFFTNFVAKH